MDLEKRDYSINSDCLAFKLSINDIDFVNGCFVLYKRIISTKNVIEPQLVNVLWVYIKHVHRISLLLYRLSNCEVILIRV